MKKLSAFIVLVATVTGAGCDSGGNDGSDNDGPWVGDWIQVNFLSNDDNGVWDEDDLDGIGFVAKITEQEWIETDGYGNGCSVTFAYSVSSGNRYSKEASAKSEGCPAGLFLGWTESGRLEFSEGNRVMIEHFHTAPGDELLAFKWVRQ